jgi:hypothetical protein
MGSGGECAISPVLVQRGTAGAHPILQRVGQVSKGHEGSLVDGARGRSEVSPAMGVQGGRNAPSVMGFSGEQERSLEWRCNGQTLHWREIRFDTGEAPQAGGIQRGRASGPPWQDACCSTTHILPCALNGENRRSATGATGSRRMGQPGHPKRGAEAHAAGTLLPATGTNLNQDALKPPPRPFGPRW